MTLSTGDTRSAEVVTGLTRARLVQYAGASGDYNPIHTDEPFATGAGFPSVFAHGMLTMALTGNVLTDWFGTERLRRYSARFKAQVWPGDTLTTTATVTEVGTDAAEVALSTRNQDGVEVLAATATVGLS
jgi:acyl dehydratase